MAKQKPPRRRGPVVARLAAFRPVLDRIVLGVALAGVLVTAHLYIQQERGFDRGCLGFSGPQAPSADCAVVTTSEASTFLGVKNAVWGIGFYLVVAALSIALPLVARARQAQVKRLRAALIAAGFVYSLYLVYYQSAELGTFCVLCLTSAVLVATLFVLQVVDATRPPLPSSTPAVPMPALPSRREALLSTGLVVLVFVLVGADFLYFRSLERAAASADHLNLNPNAATVSETPGVSAAQECVYDAEKEPVEDYQRLVSKLDPVKGNPDAPVTVIEYFDPNCPHCASLFPIMEQVAAKYGQQARFVYKPFVLWQHSVPQSAALYAAAQEGKFFEMLALQFANQNPQAGLSGEQLRALATSIGLDADVLMQRVQSGMYLSVLQLVRREGDSIGLGSVPTVLINGRFVATASKTPECLGQLIEAAAN